MIFFDKTISYVSGQNKLLDDDLGSKVKKNQYIYQRSQTWRCLRSLNVSFFLFHYLFYTQSLHSMFIVLILCSIHINHLKTLPFWMIKSLMLSWGLFATTVCHLNSMYFYTSLRWLLVILINRSLFCLDNDLWYPIWPTEYILGIITQ